MSANATEDSHNNNNCLSVVGIFFSFSKLWSLNRTTYDVRIYIVGILIESS